MKQRKDLYQEITNKILASLEKGVAPWRKPWVSEKPTPLTMPLRHNGKAYKGINIVMLWMTAIEKGYSSPFWMTFNQAKEYGGSVRKGERGTQIVFFKTLEKEKENDKGETEEVKIPMLKGYSVFNADQIDGLPEKFYAKKIERPTLDVNEEKRKAELDAFFEKVGFDLKLHPSKAFYSPGQDYIGMPPFVQFVSANAYYATLSHELVHWTGHKRRLDRVKGSAFGSRDYAFEELIAELGAVFLCADLGLMPLEREEHAAYIKNWLKVLQSDKKAIFRAAAAAQKACDFIHGKAGTLVAEDEDEAKPAAPSAPAVDGVQASIGATPVTVERNANWVSLKFSGKPSANVRDKVKAANFRWHAKGKAWRRPMDDAAEAALAGLLN